MIQITTLLLSMFFFIGNTTNYVYSQRLWIYYNRMSSIFDVSPIDDQIVFMVSDQNACQIRDLHFVEKLGAYEVPDNLGKVQSLSWLPSSHIYMEGSNWVKLFNSDLTPLIEVDLTSLENFTAQFSVSYGTQPVIAAKISPQKIRIYKNTRVDEIMINEEFQLMSLDYRGQNIYLLNGSHVRKWSIDGKNEEKSWKYSGIWNIMIGEIASISDEVLLGSPYYFEVSSQDYACQNQISQQLSSYSFKFSQLYQNQKRVLAASSNQALLWATSTQDCSDWYQMPVASFQDINIVSYGFGPQSSVAIFTSDQTLRIFIKVELPDQPSYLSLILTFCGIILLSVTIFLVCLFKQKKRRQLNQTLLEPTKQEMVSQQIQTSFVSNKNSSEYHTQEIVIE